MKKFCREQSIERLSRNSPLDQPIPRTVIFTQDKNVLKQNVRQGTFFTPDVASF